MSIYSLVWSGHQAVLFGYFDGVISHTWLILGTNSTHSWRSLMSLQLIVGQKVVIIPPLTQCLISSQPNMYSSWIHMKPRLPGWMPPAHFQWLCPIESFWQGVLTQNVAVDNPFVIDDGQQYWQVTHQRKDIINVCLVHRPDNVVSELMYLQGLGGLCSLGV